MADHQRVIEFLRDVRQGVGAAGLQTVTDEVSHMAAEYAALCEQANERLRKCSGFLQQGLRSEAIHLAEESPNLLELISQLDLPDPQQWAEFCQNNGLPVPPALQLERAAQLNEAYAQEQPLEHLFSRHRLLALSRAPVRERLDVLRKIAQLDAGSAHWEKDIRVFEKARLKELPSAFYNAVKNHDTRAIAGLNDELNQQQWFEEAPADLAVSVADAQARVQRSALEAELKKLVEPLRDAYAARSVQECQALVQRWKHLMANAGITSVAPELMDEIKPVVAFIAEQTKREEYLRRFNESCKAFTKMLDADAADAQLEAGYAKLREFKEEIPEDLTKRYMGKRTGRRKDADRKHRVKLVAIAGVLLAGIVIGLLVVLLFFRGSAEDRWAKTISAAVQKHTKQGLDEAQADVDKLQASSPGMLREPHVAAAVSELKGAQERYNSDAARLPVLLKKLDDTGKAADAVLGKGNATMDEIRAAAASLEAAVSEGNAILNDITWVDPDGKLKAAIAAAQSQRGSLRERVTATARTEMEAIDKALADIPANPASPELARQAQLDLAALDDRAHGLLSLPLLEGEARTAAENLGGRVAQRRQAAGLSGSVAGELESIRSHATSAAELRVALNAFMQKFPNDVRTPEFKAAIDTLKPAEALENWQQLMAAFAVNKDGRLMYAPSSAKDAQGKLDAVTKFIADHPEVPKAAEAAAYADYLKHAADALADKGAWQNGLADFLASPMMTDVGYVDVSDGRRYFTLGDIKRQDKRMNNQTTVSFEALDPKPDDKGAYDFTKRIKINVDPPAYITSNPVPTPAPHTKAVGTLVDDLKLINESNWDAFGVDQADKLLRNDAIDPVVRAMLLQQILKTETDVAGGAIGDAYDRPVADLGRQNPTAIPWWDPSKVSAGTKDALKQIAAEIPQGTSVKQKLAAARAAMFKGLALDGMTAGVLLKDDTGTWAVYTKALPVGQMAVWAVFLPGKDGAAAKLVQVGATAGGKFVLDETKLRDVPQGSIAFVAKQ